MRFILIGVLLTLVSTTYAKDLTSRLGVGFSNQMIVDLPGLVAKYYPNNSLGLSAAIGVDTENNASKFGFLVKVFRVIFPEDHMNFYMGAGAGLLSLEQQGSNSSGFELSGFVGGEFFFTGLESLGFSFEAGIGVISISNGVRFRTIGHSPIQAGITFYF